MSTIFARTLSSILYNTDHMQEPPPPPPVEQTIPSCARWRMEAYPVLNDGSDITIRSADGAMVANGVKDLTLVRSLVLITICDMP